MGSSRCVHSVGSAESLVAAAVSAAAESGVPRRSLAAVAGAAISAALTLTGEKTANGSRPVLTLNQLNQRIKLNRRIR